MQHCPQSLRSCECLAASRAGSQTLDRLLCCDSPPSPRRPRRRVCDVPLVRLTLINLGLLALTELAEAVEMPVPPMEHARSSTPACAVPTPCTALSLGAVSLRLGAVSRRCLSALSLDLESQRGGGHSMAVKRYPTSVVPCRILLLCTVRTLHGHISAHGAEHCRCSLCQ